MPREKKKDKCFINSTAKKQLPPAYGLCTLKFRLQRGREEIFPVHVFFGGGGGYASIDKNEQLRILEPYTLGLSSTAPISSVIISPHCVVNN